MAQFRVWEGEFMLDKHTQNKDHEILNQLKEFIDFYDGLSFTVMHFIPLGTKALFNFDTYIYEAMKGTLESILVLIENGRVNDAYALLRKFYDISLINVYVNLYLKREFEIDKFVVVKIQNWLSGKEKIPEYKEIRQYISTSLLKPIQKELSKLPYESIRNRCNDHMHYNFFSHLMMNTHVVDIKRSEKLDQFLKDIRYVILLNLSYIFYLNPHYMTSGDIFDYHDSGLIPPDNLQYEVAPFIQNIFDSLIRVEAPLIAKLVKSNCSMNLN